MDTSLVLGLGGLIITPILGGVGWFFKTRRDDLLTEKLNYEKVINDLRAENKSLLQARLDDEIKRREAVDVTNKTLGDMMTMLKQQKGLVS